MHILKKKFNLNHRLITINIFIMKTFELLEILKNHQNKALLFEYAPNKIAPANYHLTEVKNTTFESVDCGGNSNTWQETILQLWESPKEIGKTDFITTQKALAILDKVNRIKPLVLNAEAKIEYGNDTFHTSVMKITDIQISEEALTLKLHSEATKCKAPDICGVPEEETEKESCCGPTGCC